MAESNSMSKRSWWIFALGMALLLPLPAKAQNDVSASQPTTASDDDVTAGTGRAKRFLEAGQTVRDRARPRVSPRGGRLGAFMVFPSLAVTEAYDDNIFRQNNNEEEDFITFIRPTLTFNSLWSRHSLDVTFRGEQALYADNTDENYTNFSAAANGRIDIQRSSNIYIEGSFERLHEERDSPEDVFGEEPTEYDRTHGVLGVVHEMNPITIDIQGNVTDLNFKDVDARNAVGEINNDDRDRTMYEAVGEVSFSTSPRYDLFVRGSYNIRNYESAVDDLGRDRESEGWRAAAGVDFEISALTFGNIFVGYQSQDFDDPALSTVDGLDFGAEITWNATQLTTFNLAVERAIEETTRQNASSRVRSTVSMSADHELLRNLLVGVDALYQKEDFEGVNRDDDRFEAGASIDYLWNRHLDASLSYRYQKRASTLDREDFTANVVMLTVEVAL